MSRQPHFLQLCLRRGAGEFVLCDATDRRVVAKLELAFDSASRRKGLLGRDALPPDTAVVIAPCNAVHTWFMRFPIDIVFAARDGRVVKVRREVRPWRVSAALGAFATIEFAAGRTNALGLREGCRVEVVERPPG